jgi:DNA modification methylase
LKINDLKIVDSEDKKNYTLENLKNKVIHGDALQVLKKFPCDSADLVFIDPPYFLQLPKKKLKRWNVKTDVEGVEDEWDKFDSFEEYDIFIQTILEEVKRIMKANASIWIISTYHSIFRIGKLMQDLGFWILNSVTWVKSNPMPNWLGVRFTNATETLIWATKNKDVKAYTFDKVKAKEFGVGKVGANVWIIPLCTGKERLKDDEGKKLHSTQKPSELLRRVILTSSKEGDLILDPLAGVGTTGFVARNHKREFIMIEKNDKYIEGIIKRFSQEETSTKTKKIRKDFN